MCGYTYEQCRATPLSHYNRLCAYWSRHPPVHLMVAAYLGIKSEPRRVSGPRSAPARAGDGAQPTWETESVEDLMRRWAAAGQGFM